MAVTLTSAQFIEYLEDVKLTVGSTDYSFPIWNLTITVHPWSGVDSPAQRLADGRIRQKVRGWHVTAEFDANFGYNGSDNCTAVQAVEALLETGVGTLDLDPIDNAGVRTLTVVLKEPDGLSRASFDGHVRNRPWNVVMITQDQFATAAIPTWLAGNS